jgi:hypothetical protein
MEQHTFAGITFEGRRQIAEVLTEIERQKKGRIDQVLRSDRIEATCLDNEFLFRVQGSRDTYLVPVTKRVHTQLAQYMGLRMTDRFYKWLSNGDQDYDEDKPEENRRNWKVWTGLINDYLKDRKEYRLCRLNTTPEGQTYMRAFLSDRYKVINNADFFYAIAEKLQESKAELWHARLSEDKFFGYAVAPGIAGQITTDRTFDPGDGWQSRWYGEKGDAVNAAVAFGNSETGEGGIFLKQAVLRRICVNYCVWHDIVAQTHIGKRNDADVLLSQETLDKQNEVFFLKIRDLVAGSFDAERFQDLVDSMNEATRERVPDPDKAAEALVLVYNISEERARNIRNLLVRSGDLSRYGLAQAVTEEAHKTSLPAEAGFDLEKLGGDLLQKEFAPVLAFAGKLAEEKSEVRRAARPPVVNNLSVDI